jgi:predicted phosphodiesterase
MKRILAGLALSILLGAPAGAAPTAWVQYNTDGRAEVRLVTDEACPGLKVDGRRLRTRERAGPTEAFANRICSARLPRGARRASLGGEKLPLPRARPDRLVIIGDTGCRVKGPVVQDCRDPVAGWPFARIAALAAARKPDLVIHVGDYYYRETPCPAGKEAACGGGPYGDKWETWKAEWFDPAAPLLAAAPIVLARGNHEDCRRGGLGWFRLLDASPKPRACPQASDTFAVELGGTRLLVLDSADPDDNKADPDQAAAFGARLDEMRRLQGAEPGWLVTHRPVWFAFRAGGKLVDGMTNATERAAVKDRDLAGVQMVLAGHVHNFTSMDFGPARPAQLIVGTGGDLLNGEPASSLSGTLPVDGLDAATYTMDPFGYLVLDRAGKDWVGAFHDLTDAVVATCRLHDRTLHCEDAAR